MRDAPWPDGASEFVDVDQELALRAGFRYAVMLVNAYAGLPLSALERGFAGLMLRDDAAGGPSFDARTVQWKFTLHGENGVFLPLVFDLRERDVYWLDVQSKGQFEMNNVETSRKAVRKICPALMSYFASGTRASMWDLGLLHAAARCERVTVRGSKGMVSYVRATGESVAGFHGRMCRGGRIGHRDGGGRWAGVGGVVSQRYRFGAGKYCLCVVSGKADQDCRGN